MENVAAGLSFTALTNVLRFDLKESREGIGNVVLVRHKALCIKKHGRHNL